MAFEFNDCNVCTNPEIVFERKHKGIEYALKVAEHGGGWFFGLSANINHLGVCTGIAYPVKNDAYRHDTRDEAMASAVGNLIEWANSVVSSHPELTPLLKEVVRAEFLIVPKSEQLTLF